LNRKAFVFVLATLLSVVSSNAIMSAWSQTEALDFRYRASAVGECVIAYGGGGAGPGFPYPMKWAGTGDGQAMANGFAADATETFPISVPDVYLSESIRAKGAVSARWTEQDGSKHRLMVTLYSTETSEAVFYPSNDQFALAIPAYSQPPNTIRFQGIFLNGSETENISGFACFASGINCPYPWPDRIFVLLGVEQSETLFILAWSRTNTVISLGEPPNPPTFVALSAAKLYQTEVKTL